MVIVFCVVFYFNYSFEFKFLNGCFMSKNVKYKQKNGVVYKEETNFLGITTSRRYGTVKNGKVKKDESLFDIMGSYVKSVGKSLGHIDVKKSETNSLATQGETNDDKSNDDNSFANTHNYRCESVINEIDEYKRKSNAYLFGIVFLCVLFFISCILIFTQKHTNNQEPESFSFVYNSNGGGHLEYEQNGQIYAAYKVYGNIHKGTDIRTVTAVPDNGYEFYGWSDGVATAKRTDKNITFSFEVTAYFRKI